MSSIVHTTTHNARTVAVAAGRRWPALALGIGALLALALLVVGPSPAAAAPYPQTNQKPTFKEEAITLTVPENSRAGDQIGEPLPAAIDPDDDALFYTLAGPDKDSFDFNSSTRQISVGRGTNPDYESRTAPYRVTLQVSDRKNRQGGSNGGDVIDDTISVTINVTDVPEPPGRPTPPTVRVADTDGDTTLEITWAAPTNTGPPITGYDVRYRPVGSSSFTAVAVEGAGTSVTISGLEPDTDYQVQISARNDEGASGWSDFGTVRTPSATTPCTGLEIYQDDETTAGATVDLTLRFTPRGCDPTGRGDLRDEITITLSEDIVIPSGFSKDDIVLRARQRYALPWADISRNNDEPHEILLPGCPDWTAGSDDEVCGDADFPISIRLSDLKLPDQPADSDDPYEVTVQWANGSVLRDTVGVDANLEVDGDAEVRYGETVKFEGSGFADGLSVNVYANPGTSSASCEDIGNWREIGNATVDRRRRFTVAVEITQSYFPNAEKYRVCARDGEGTTNGTSIFIEVEPGLEVVGGSDRQYAPGEEVTLRLVGGSGQQVDSVLVGGRVLDRSQWQRSGDNLRVKLPASGSGKITVLANFRDGSKVSVNVNMADITLNVAGYRTNVGIGLGQTVIARANNLSGASEVSRITLDGVPLTFLDGNDPVQTVTVSRGGQFIATVLIDDPDENRVSLIRKIIDDSDGAAKLSIETDNGITASAEVELAVPAVSVICPNGRECDEDNNVAKRGETLIIRGKNFPPDLNYYDAPEVEVVINDRDDDVDQTANTSWEYRYEVRLRGEECERLEIDVTIDDYSLREILDDDLRKLRVACAELAAAPDTVLIGAPIKVTATGLPGFASGFFVQIRNGPPLEFGGEPDFASDGSGSFTGTTRVPEDFHQEEVARSATREIRLELHHRGERMSGVNPVVITLSRGYQSRRPDAPTVPSVAADGAFGLAVTWVKPANDGGSPVTGYDLQYRVGNSGSFTNAGYSGAGAGHTITGLLQGTQYQVRVRANNAEGLSEWSWPGTGATEPLAASIETMPGSESVAAGEPARFRIILSHAATITVKLAHRSAGGFGADASGECRITAGNICEYSVSTSKSPDSDSGSLTVEIAPAPEYVVGTPSARAALVNPAPPLSPAPEPTDTPTATPIPDPTPTPAPEPTDTPTPEPTTVVVAPTAGTEAGAVRDLPATEEESDDGSASPLAVTLSILAGIVVLAGAAGGGIWLYLRRRTRGSIPDGDGPNEAAES